MPTIVSPHSPAAGRGVTAVLGPTNTGKTHMAIERMVSHETGLIGLPLRLLAREVYERVAERVGVGNVALVTGEEKINTAGKPRYVVATVEAMPDTTDADFVAIDEVQLAADLERGHIFTDRILNLRGRRETMLLGAATVRRLLEDLLPGISIVTRPRMSMLIHAGSKKITRLPRRSAIVAFSADEVYAIAELIRRQRGGAAVVLGSLSPRTRNAQVALYQSGDVDFMVATDAIGMGLNLDLDHVAFAQDRKYDGLSHRRLTPAEMGQIAGRAGRHVRDGSFGSTGHCPPFEEELVERLETHQFDPVKVLVWRNRDLDFTGIDTLKDSLEAASSNRLLMKSFPAPDLVALENLTRDPAIANLCTTRDTVQMLWEVCKIPDFRRISPGEHAELLRSIFGDLARRGKIDPDWFAKQVKLTDRTDGDIDALSARIAHVRTWTFLSNHAGWVADARHWQARTREIEDRLSDALHESLTKRFIDRRTSVLMKRLRENAMLEAQISVTGDVVVEGHPVGKLIGFRFTPDSSATGADAKAAAAAAQKALAAEIGRRAERMSTAANGDIALSSDSTLRWQGEPVAKMVTGEDRLKPRVILLADEQLSGPHRDMVAQRLDRWVAFHIATLLKPLVDLAADETLQGIARGVAFRLVESFGVIDRREIATDIQALDQDMRAGLRRHGVRFGAFHVFIPALLKPAPASLIGSLFALTRDTGDVEGLSQVQQMLASGRTSFPATDEIAAEAYVLCGYRKLGEKAVRIDILERLADLIRPALSWRKDGGTPPPEGAIDGRCFHVTPAMLSILGATHDNMEVVLKNLGYRAERKQADAAGIPEQALRSLGLLKTPPIEKPAAEPAVEASSEQTSDEMSQPASIAIEVENEAPTESSAEAVSAVAVVPAADGDTIPVEPVATANAETPEAAAEPQFVTLWRPGRAGGVRNDQEHRRRPNRNSGRRPDNAEASAEGAQPAEQQDAKRGGWRGKGRQGDRPAHTRNDGRPEGRQDGRPGARDGEQAGAQDGKRDGGDRRGRDGRHFDKNSNRDKPVQPERAPRPQKPMDPDSPFAKLAALKARLEGRDA